MNVFRNFDEINFNSDTVLTVGTFDGVHRGHQYIIKNLLNISNKHSLRNLIITIHPHPQIVLNKPGKPPVLLLTSIEERLELFEKYGVDNVLIIPFNYEFSLTPARNFITDYLIKKIGFKRILIGYDHLFGRDRSGNEELLIELSNEHNFEIEKLERIDLENHRISSTDIRHSVLNSDIHIANNLLGHNYSLRGMVIHGHKRGRTIGFPTANILPDDKNKLIPANGVYFVFSNINNRKVWGMANIGFRPTVTNENVLSIESHFFDFDEDIYDTNLTIQFVSKIRDEYKFSGIEALIEQLNKDKNTCLNLIS
jgi:riboflavin kinase/FMN adenylyltransferase